MDSTCTISHLSGFLSGNQWWLLVKQYHFSQFIVKWSCDKSLFFTLLLSFMMTVHFLSIRYKHYSGTDFVFQPMCLSPSWASNMHFSSRLIFTLLASIKKLWKPGLNSCSVSDFDTGSLHFTQNSLYTTSCPPPSPETHVHFHFQKTLQ